MTGRRRVALLGLGMLLVGGSLAPAEAQEWSRRRPSRAPVDETMGDFPYDARLTFARIRFDTGSRMAGWYGNGPEWAHDYPIAERNFMRILDDITAARTYMGGSRILTLDDPELFKYPIAYLCEPGHWRASDAEVGALRAYLEKGGFIIFDDFSGRDWYNFEEVMQRVLPGVKMLPMSIDHPVFHAFFEIESLDMAHPNYRGVSAQFYGIFEDNDPTRRLMGIVNYNNDIGDYFEYSATGWVPVSVSNEAYKLGVNYWMYALTH